MDELLFACSMAIVICSGRFRFRFLELMIFFNQLEMEHKKRKEIRPVAKIYIGKNEMKKRDVEFGIDI